MSDDAPDAPVARATEPERLHRQWDGLGPEALSEDWDWARATRVFGDLQDVQHWLESEARKADNVVGAKILRDRKASVGIAARALARLERGEAPTWRGARGPAFREGFVGTPDGDLGTRVQRALAPAVAIECLFCRRLIPSEDRGDEQSDGAPLKSSACELDDGRWVCSRDCWTRAVRMWDEAPAVGAEAVAWRWKYRSRPGMDWSLARVDPGTSDRLRVQPLGVIGPDTQGQPHAYVDSGRAWDLRCATCGEGTLHPRHQLPGPDTREPTAPESVPGVYSLRHLREAWLDGWGSAGAASYVPGVEREDAWHEFSRRAGLDISEPVEERAGTAGEDAGLRATVEVYREAHMQTLKDRDAAHAILTDAGIPLGTLAERVEALMDRNAATVSEMAGELEGAVREVDRMLAQRGPEGERLEGTVMSVYWPAVNALCQIGIEIGAKDAPRRPHCDDRVYIIVPPEGRAEGGRGDAGSVEPGVVGGDRGGAVAYAVRGGGPDAGGEHPSGSLGKPSVAPPASAQAGAGEARQLWTAVAAALDRAPLWMKAPAGAPVPEEGA